MPRIHLTLPPLLAAVVLSGCGSTERVQVGALAPSVDFGTCLGDDTDCEQGFPPARQIEPTYAATQCELVEDDGWRVAWWRNTTRRRCAPVGYCDAGHVSVAADGTFWTASLGQSPVEASDETLFGLFLVHYDQDGEIIAQDVVETGQLLRRESAFDDNPIKLAIAAEARGHLYVALGWTEDEVWVGEFDAAARPVGQRVRLEGLQGNSTLGLAVARDGSVLVSARTVPPRSTQPELNALAKLDSSLQPVWLQTRVLPPSRFWALLPGGPRLTLVGDTDTEPGSWGVRQVGTLDQTGNLVDLLHVAVMEAPFAVDRNGNLFGLAVGLDRPSIATKLSPQGDVLFQVEVVDARDPNDADVVHQLGATVDPEGNSFYALRREEYEPGFANEILTLWRLDADGARCSVSNIVAVLAEPGNNSNLHEVSELFRTTNGDLYVRTQSGLARLTR